MADQHRYLPAIRHYIAITAQIWSEIVARHQGREVYRVQRPIEKLPDSGVRAGTHFAHWGYRVGKDWLKIFFIFFVFYSYEILYVYALVIGAR